VAGPAGGVGVACIQGGLRLAEFRILAPGPQQVIGQLRAAGIGLPVGQADTPALQAVLTGPQGTRVVLVS